MKGRSARRASKALMYRRQASQPTTRYRPSAAGVRRLVARQPVVAVRARMLGEGPDASAAPAGEPALARPEQHRQFGIASAERAVGPGPRREVDPLVQGLHGARQERARRQGEHLPDGFGLARLR